MKSPCNNTARSHSIFVRSMLSALLHYGIMCHSVATGALPPRAPYPTLWISTLTPPACVRETPISSSEAWTSAVGLP